MDRAARYPRLDRTGKVNFRCIPRRKPGDVFFAPSRRFLVHFYRTCTKQAAALVFRGAAVYNNIIRQDFSARKQINKRTDGAAERPRPGQRLKGKQVQFLYDLVTVNGEHSAFMSLMCASGRRRRAQIRKSGHLPPLLVRKAFPGHESLTVLMPHSSA